MDYNIYIRDMTGGGKSGRKTAAWKANKESETKSWKEDDDESLNTINQVVNTVSNPDSLIGMGTSWLAKAVPAIAVAMVIAGVVDRAISTVDSFITPETGDYRFNTRYTNFKAPFNNLTKPFSMAINIMRTEQQIHLASKRNEQYRQLLGDISINNMNNFGV